MQIYDFRDARARQIWATIPVEAYDSPYHTIHNLDAPGNEASPKIFCVIEAEGKTCYTAFTCYDQWANCLFSGTPFLSKGTLPSAQALTQALAELAQKLGRSLYFPQVYRHTQSATSLLTSEEVQHWSRLSSPIIDFEQKQESLIERAVRRIGKQALRRVRMFDRLQAQIRRVAPENIAAVLREVESQSWKAELGQDMMSRGQWEWYTALGQSKQVHLRAAFVEGRPIAYSFDYQLGDCVYPLKWSFVQAFGRYSPGFYMLVKNGDEYWSERSIKLMDLHGSPDALKSAIEDIVMARERLDFAYGDHQLIAYKRTERLAHDQKIWENFCKGQSIKKIYKPQLLKV